MFDILPHEIIYVIQTYLKFIGIYSLKTCNKFLYNVIKIYEIHRYYSGRLNDNILTNYAYLAHLDARNNENITNILHMPFLRGLIASLNCGIPDYQMAQFDFFELTIDDNQNISIITHLTKLVDLQADGVCSINDSQLTLFNLDSLIARNNPNISNIYHQHTLLRCVLD
jgi:hypothetical protein